MKNKQKKPNPFLNNEIEKMTPHFLSFGWILSPCYVKNEFA